MTKTAIPYDMKSSDFNYIMVYMYIISFNKVLNLFNTCQYIYTYICSTWNCISSSEAICFFLFLDLLKRSAIPATPITTTNVTAVGTKIATLLGPWFVTDVEMWYLWNVPFSIKYVDVVAFSVVLNGRSLSLLSLMVSDVLFGLPG